MINSCREIESGENTLIEINLLSNQDQIAIRKKYRKLRQNQIQEVVHLLGTVRILYQTRGIPWKNDNSIGLT